MGATPTRPPEQPDTGTPPRNVAICYGGGGMFGIAWHLAATQALREAGIDIDAATLTGTSAGSWAAVAARTGTDVDDFAAVGNITVPNLTSGALHRIATDLFGENRHVNNVNICVTELPTLRRRIHTGTEHPVADLVAASSAVPGLFAPHRIGGRHSIDGGMRSMTSIDSIAAADLLIVSLPLAGRLYGAAGRTLELTCRRALAKWRHRHGGTTVVIAPDSTVADRIGSDPRSLFSVSDALNVHPAALDAARRHLDERRDVLGALGSPNAVAA